MDDLLPPRELLELEAQRATTLWDETLTFLEKGKREDEAGNYSSAILLFSEGVDGLKALTNVQKREDVLQQYDDILRQYSARIFELHALLLQPGQQQQQPTPAAVVESGQPVGAAGTPPAPPPAAAALAQGRLCAELAIAADEAGERDEETINLYTAAAEHYLAALKLEDGEAARTQHRGRLTRLLERAEVLKNPAAAAAARAAAPTPAPPAPGTAGGGKPPAPSAVGASSSRAPVAAGLSGEEKEVLARSSTISGVLFYPWLGDGQRERFHFAQGWEDPDGLLPLSEQQRKHFGRWARPSQFMRAEPKMIYLVSSLSITQVITSDCLLIASDWRPLQHDDPPRLRPPDADDHHRLLLRLVARDRRRVRAQARQAADHEDDLAAGLARATHLQPGGQVPRQAACQRHRAQGAR